MTQTTVQFASEVVKNETLALDAIEESYEAVNRMFEGDYEPIRRIWSEDAGAVLMGACGGRQIGYWNIVQGFAAKGECNCSGHVTPRDVLVRLGTELAYSVCIERGEITAENAPAIPLELRATRILKHEGDAWRVLYHHSDPLEGLPPAPDGKPAEFAPTEVGLGEPGVIKALDALYAGIRSMFAGDLKPLEAVWRKGDDVTLATPAGGLQVGWEAVQAAFKAHSTVGIRGTMDYRDAFIRVFGDVAYASYLEVAPDLYIKDTPCPLKVRATTIFRRTNEAGKWYVVHHHADLAPGLPELCKGEPAK